MVMLFPQFSARPSLWTAHPGSRPGANPLPSCLLSWVVLSRLWTTGNWPSVQPSQACPNTSGQPSAGTFHLLFAPRELSVIRLCLSVSVSAFRFLGLLEDYHKLGGLKAPHFVA